MAEATKTSVNNIKKWKRLPEEDLIPNKRGKRVTNAGLEEELKEWVRNHRLKKNPVCVRMLIVEGKKRAKIKNIEGLKFSWGWVRGFLNRNQFKLKKVQNKVNKEANEIENSVLEFKEKIKNLILTGNYDFDFILNVDETGIATESIKSKIITLPEEEKETNIQMRDATVKSCNKEKENTTVLLGGTWTGKKIPALVILPGKGKKKLKIDQPENLRIEFREEGSYMDRDVMMKWANYTFRNFARELPPNKRGMLLIDNFKGHLSDDIENYIKTFRFDILKFPANTTKYLQPMDLAVNRSMKSFYSQKWEDFIASRTDQDLTKAGNYKGPSREERISWISYAWNQVTSRTVSNGFQVYKRYIDPDINDVDENKEEDPEIQEIVASKDEDEGQLDIDNEEEVFELDNPEPTIPNFPEIDIASYFIVSHDEQ